MATLNIPVQSTSPADVIKNLEQDAAQSAAREQKLMEDVAKAERDRELLQKRVYEVANPSPILITCVVLGVLLMLYIIYMIFLRPCLSGEWVDPSGNIWHIAHNRMSGQFSVCLNGEPSGSGKVMDNYVQYGDLIGVWNYGRVIVFTEGWHLERLLCKDA